MSTDTLKRVVEFEEIADELSDMGHCLRAAENYGRAAEAARALGANNLVELYMRVLQGNMLCATAVSAPGAATADPCVHAAPRTESIGLFFGAVVALRHRQLADTLLDGKCAAAETLRGARVMHRHGKMSKSQAASKAQLVGYEFFLNAAANVMAVLRNADLFAAECSYAQLQSFVQHVVQAADLLQQPRRCGQVALKVETLFTDGLRWTVDKAGDHGLDARLVHMLVGAWERLQRSGVLQARGIEQRTGWADNMRHDFTAALEESFRAPGLRSCALGGCGAKEAHPAHFKSCAACRTVVYCCREHQMEGWPAHKKACIAARKEAAASEDGAGPSGA